MPGERYEYVAGRWDGRLDATLRACMGIGLTEDPADLDDDEEEL